MDGISGRLIFPSVDSHGSECIRRSIETDVASFDDMVSATELLTKMMERLMSLREGILVRLRKTGRIK
jgi:hypothetical protein